MADTIVAIATPVGRSGIGVIRLSGSDALTIVQKIAVGRPAAVPRKAVLRRLAEPLTGEVVDVAIVVYYPGPNSFTGEDVVEISCHGSPVILRRVLEICVSLGARIAEPGGFSLRALANGRMDLAEAEAIRDLIDARTVAAARQALRQMQGEFSHQLQPVKDDLLDAIVLLESALEFVEDDLPENETAKLAERLEAIAGSIEKIAATFSAGRMIREGIRVVIVGRPNVGKSSLFNALLGIDRAIVTDIAGTTRDQLHEQFTIGNIPVSLIDTAGLREATDEVEVIGVQRSKQAMADADLVVAILDSSEELTEEDLDVLAESQETNRVIVLNKTDKIDRRRLSGFSQKVADAIPLPEKENARAVPTSAVTGEGLEELKRSIVEPFDAGGSESAGFLVSDARHFDLLARSGQAVRESVALLRSGKSEEIVLIGLHNALGYLGQITGETTTEDMLTRIFATFCIGK